MAIYKEAPSKAIPDSIAFENLGIYMDDTFIPANSFGSVGLGEFSKNGTPPHPKGNGRGIKY